MVYQVIWLLLPFYSPMKHYYSEIILMFNNLKWHNPSTLGHIKFEPKETLLEQSHFNVAQRDNITVKSFLCNLVEMKQIQTLWFPIVFSAWFLYLFSIGFPLNVYTLLLRNSQIRVFHVHFFKKTFTVCYSHYFNLKKMENTGKLQETSGGFHMNVMRSLLDLPIHEYSVRNHVVS